MLKAKWLLIVLALSGCGTSLPEPPPVWQCAWSVKFQRFYCTHTESGQKITRDPRSPVMDGGQCLSRSDYEAESRWVAQLIEEAKKRCK